MSSRMGLLFAKLVPIERNRRVGHYTIQLHSLHSLTRNPGVAFFSVFFLVVHIKYFLQSLRRLLCCSSVSSSLLLLYSYSLHVIGLYTNDMASCKYRAGEIKNKRRGTDTTPDVNVDACCHNARAYTALNPLLLL